MTYPELTLDLLRARQEQHSTGDIGAYVYRLPPETAVFIKEEMNSDNYRALTKEKVEKFAGYMEEGSWRCGIANVGFSADGILRNGQHTVSAAAHEAVRDLPADKQPVIVFTFGLGEDSGDFFDAPGSSRTPGQQAKYHGHTESAEVTTAQLFLSYLAGHRTQATERSVARLQVPQLFEKADAEGYSENYAAALKCAKATVYRPRKTRIFKSSNNKYGVAGEVTVDEGNENGLRCQLTPLVVTYLILAHEGFDNAVIQRYFYGLAGDGLHPVLSDPRAALRSKMEKWDGNGAAGSKAVFLRLQSLLLAFGKWYAGTPSISVISAKMLLPDLPEADGPETPLTKN